MWCHSEKIPRRGRGGQRRCVVTAAAIAFSSPHSVEVVNAIAGLRWSTVHGSGGGCSGGRLMPHCGGDDPGVGHVRTLVPPAARGMVRRASGGQGRAQQPWHGPQCYPQKTGAYVARLAATQQVLVARCL